MLNNPGRERTRRFIFSLLAICLIGSTAQAGKSSYQKEIFRARDKVLPALVHIEPILEVFRSGRQRKQAVTGSGFIISADGYVVTNNHVVQRAKKVTCTLYNRQEVEAEVVGNDPLSDLAVLKIDPSSIKGKLPVATLGDSALLEVGEFVLAMGSPLGLARSVSLGVVSSLNRYFPEGQLSSGVPTGRYNTWIQTDAAINPGNSGGPLVNLQGEVVGVNARAITIVGENLGFAIPINLTREVVRELIDQGDISRSWIGISWQELQPLARYLGVSADQGAVVANVASGSPGEEAGLIPGDVVMAFDDEPVHAKFLDDLPALEKVVADMHVDREVNVLFLRDGKAQVTRLRTRKQPEIEASEAECREWGFTVQQITAEISRNMKLAGVKGVLISGVRSESFAADAGLRVGDVLQQIEAVAVEQIAGFRSLCEKHNKEHTEKLLAQVRRGRVVAYHVLKPYYKEPDSQRASDAGDNPGADRRTP
jgi:serine protease Do